MLDRTAALPGVQSAGMSQAFPRQVLPPSTPVSFASVNQTPTSFPSTDTASPGFFETPSACLWWPAVFLPGPISAPTARVCIVTGSPRAGSSIRRRRAAAARLPVWDPLRDRQGHADRRGRSRNISPGKLLATNSHRSHSCAAAPSNGVNFCRSQHPDRHDAQHRIDGHGGPAPSWPEGGREYARRGSSPSTTCSRAPPSEHCDGHARRADGTPGDPPRRDRHPRSVLAYSVSQ